MTQTVPPDIFLLVVGIYMILLVMILTRFAGGIEYGDDRPQFMYDLGQTLPMSIIVFTVTTIISRVIFSSMVGSISKYFTAEDAKSARDKKLHHVLPRATPSVWGNPTEICVGGNAEV